MELNGTVKKKTALGGTMNQTQTLSGTMSRSGGGAGVTEVFWAIYGTTTASEINLAVQAGKLCVCEHDSKIYILQKKVASDTFQFVNVKDAHEVSILSCGGSSWYESTDTVTDSTVIVRFGQINLDDEGTLSTSTVTANRTVANLVDYHQNGKNVIGLVYVDVIDSLHSAYTAEYLVQLVMTSWEQPSVDGEMGVVSFTGFFPQTETGSLVGVSGGRITLTGTSGYTFNVALDYGTPAYFTSDMKAKLANLNPYTSNPAMDGTASPGNSSAYARGNHVHPHDTSKLDAPSGGSVGQVLKKTADGVEWANEAGGGTSDVFWATYGTTTLAELQAAWADGKTILISYQGNVYYLSSVTGNNNSSFVFHCPSWSQNGRAQLYELINSYGTWNYSAYEGSDYILAPSSPATGAFLVWNGSAWTAQTLSTWSGGSY